MRFRVSLICIASLGTAVVLAGCVMPPPLAPTGKPIVLERRPPAPPALRRPHAVASRATGAHPSAASSSAGSPSVLSPSGETSPAETRFTETPAGPPPAALLLSPAEKEVLFQRFEASRTHAAAPPAGP